MPGTEDLGMPGDPLMPRNEAPKGADPRLVSAHGRAPNLTIMIFVGGMTAALFGSRVVLQEIQTQPDMLAYETIRQIGLRWHQAMQRVGAAAPDRALHAGVRDTEALGFKQ